MITPSSPHLSAERNIRLDSLKFCLILLVIVGHVFSQPTFRNVEVCQWIWKWIYLFHMPLFVFLSGYFSRKKPFREYLSSCGRLLEALLLCQIILLYHLHLNHKHIGITEILTPQWILWYFLSLTYWRTLIQFVPQKVLDKSRLLIPLTFIIALGAGFLPLDRFLSLQRSLAFLPFFYLGYYMRGRQLCFGTKRMKILCSVFLVATCVIPIFFANYLGDLYLAQPYKNISGLYGRLLVFSLAIPMSVAFITVCPNSLFLAQEGKKTLSYLVFHSIIIIFTISHLKDWGFYPSVRTAIDYTVCLIIVVVILLQFPFFVKLPTPSAFFKDMHKKRGSTMS